MTIMQDKTSVSVFCVISVLIEIILVIQRINGHQHLDYGGGVYCETEAFNATCDMGYAILMTRAQYGRMKLSRCVKQDYGHVGCAADVIDLADARCSARRKCTIRIPDAALATTKPCPDDLKPYLEADYVCVKVQTPTDLCDDSTGVRVSNPRSGYLTNLVTEATGCGTTRAPWLLEARPGQTIRLTLYDFNSASSTSSVSKGGIRASSESSEQETGAGIGGGRTRGEREGGEDVQLGETRVLPGSDEAAWPGHPYAVVKEPLYVGKNLTVYGGLRARKTAVYTSLGHVLEVAILISDDVLDVSYFMFKYEVIGCPDTITVPHGWAVRVGETQHVYCNNSALRVQYLRCSSNVWTGDFDNCTSGTSAIIALLTAVTIGLMVLGFGLMYFRKRHLLVQQKRCSSSRVNAVHSLQTLKGRARINKISDRYWVDSRCYRAGRCFPEQCNDNTVLGVFSTPSSEAVFNSEYRIANIDPILPVTICDGHQCLDVSSAGACYTRPLDQDVGCNVRNSSVTATSICPSDTSVVCIPVVSVSGGVTGASICCSLLRRCPPEPPPRSATSRRDINELRQRVNSSTRLSIDDLQGPMSSLGYNVCDETELIPSTYRYEQTSAALEGDECGESVIISAQCDEMTNREGEMRTAGADESLFYGNNSADCRQLSVQSTHSHEFDESNELDGLVQHRAFDDLSSPFDFASLSDYEAIEQLKTISTLHGSVINYESESFCTERLFSAAGSTYTDDFDFGLKQIGIEKKSIDLRVKEQRFLDSALSENNTESSIEMNWNSL